MKVVLFEIYKDGTTRLRYNSGERLTVEELKKLEEYVKQLQYDIIATSPRKD